MRVAATVTGMSFLICRRVLAAGEEHLDPAVLGGHRVGAPGANHGGRRQHPAPRLEGGAGAWGGSGGVQLCTVGQER